jgi:hypothetical protein
MANKRVRKKWLKKNGRYVDVKDTWGLDCTFAEFAIPRLKLFKKVNNGYPGHGDADTPEKWDEIIDKMIEAFELHIDLVETSNKYFLPTGEFDKARYEEDSLKEKEGLKLFAEWFGALWW